MSSGPEPGTNPVAQEAVRHWWSEHPMTYDWQGTIEAPIESDDYLAEVERRFFAESWFAHGPGQRPFSRLIPFDELRGKDVLEIGCGTGVHAKLLAESGARLTAVDLTPTAVEFTKRRLDAAGVEASVLEADAEQLPFPDASFDFVWSWGVIHHSANTDAVIEEIARVLRPGGEVRLMVYHRNSITWWFNYMFVRGVLGGRLLRERPAEVANRYSDGVLARHYTRRRLTAKLSPRFENVSMQVFGQMAEALPMPRRVRPVVGKAFPPSLRRALLRRAGWFLFATATRRS